MRVEEVSALTPGDMVAVFRALPEDGRAVLTEQVENACRAHDVPVPRVHLALLRLCQEGKARTWSDGRWSWARREGGA